MRGGDLSDSIANQPTVHQACTQRLNPLPVLTVRDHQAGRPIVVEHAVSAVGLHQSNECT
jgi:hypothetical protein